MILNIEVLLTSVILLVIGCVVLVKSNTLIKNIISIETITLSSILNLLYYKDISNNILLLLAIIVISELSIAILFVINSNLSNDQKM